MHAFSPWLSGHPGRAEPETYLFKMLRIQPLKHIQKVNVNVKLEGTPGTSLRPRCPPRLCPEDSVGGAVDGVDEFGGS